MEKFLDLAYRRDSEAPRSWPFRSLTGPSAAGLSMMQKQTVVADAALVALPLGAGAMALSPPFYPASQFKLHGRTPLPWPEQERQSPFIRTPAPTLTQLPLTQLPLLAAAWRLAQLLRSRVGGRPPLEERQHAARVCAEPQQARATPDTRSELAQQRAAWLALPRAAAAQLGWKLQCGWPDAGALLPGGRGATDGGAAARYHRRRPRGRQ